MKFNCDGTFKRGSASIGVVRRNSDGSLINGLGCKVNVISSLQSELLAIRKAYMIITQQRIAHSIVESDCKVVVHLLQSDNAPPWDSAVVIEDIRFMASVSSISFSFVPRSGNRAAH